MAESENIFLTEKQVASKYQVSTRTLHNLRKDGKLENGKEYFYLGKQIRYKSIELQEYFETSTLKRLKSLLYLYVNLTKHNQL